MDDKYEQYEFEIPPGLSLPEGHEESNKPFDMVCTLQVKPDGKHMCILKIGDTDTPYKKHMDEGKEEKPEYKKDYSDMAQGMMSQMPEQATGAMY